MNTQAGGTTLDAAHDLPSRIRLASLCLLTLAGAIEATFSRHTMNPDGISYLDMGDAMWRGDWQMAINGYWSPLYPWLQGLALKLVHPSPYSQYSVVHFVNFLIYFFALLCFDFFLQTAVEQRRWPSNTKEDWLPSWSIFLLGYSIFFWGAFSQTKLETVSPDMLMAAFLYLGTAILLRIWSAPERTSKYLLLGAVLALGYLAKAPTFLLAFVFFAIALILPRNWRIATPRVAAALAAFLAISAVWIIPLSRAKGRLTFGDSGKVNYVLWVNGASPTYYFVTLGSAGGRYTHPLRQILDSPPVYEWATPIKGTLPIWYDASYWADGAVPRFILRRQLSITKEWVSFYIQKLFTAQLPLLTGFVLLCILAGRELATKVFSVRWPVWLIGIAGLGMFALVHVERRYVAVLYTLVWIALYTGLRTPVASSRKRFVPCIVLAAAIAMSVPATIMVLRDLVHIKSQPHLQYRVAEDLRSLGVTPGDRLARIGGRFGTVSFARLLGASVAAEVPLAHAKDFWNGTPERQTRVIEKFRELGVTAVIGDMTSSNEGFHPGPEWRPLGKDGKYYALVLSPGAAPNTDLPVVK